MCFAFQGRGKYWGKLAMSAIIGYRAPNVCVKNTGNRGKKTKNVFKR